MSPLQQKPTMHGRDHLPGGADPIPGLPDPGGDGILDILLGKNAVGLWKLDELAGETAADSSGAGNHMTVPVGGSYDPPTWGEAAGPPGTTSALFAIGAPNGGSAFEVTMPVGMVDDFSAGLWIYANDADLGGELLGQGQPHHGSGSGWALLYNNTGAGTAKFALYTDGDIALCNNANATGAWYLFGASAVAGTWTIYLNGLEQLDTVAGTPTAEQDSWIGNCGAAISNHGSNQTLSWAFITDDPLSGGDWLDLYEAGQIGGALEEGQVWTTDGLGGTSWQPNLRALSAAGESELTGDVTLSEGANITLTQSGQDIEIAATGGAAFDPATATTWWFPLVDADGTCVLDANDDLIPTLLPL